MGDLFFVLKMTIFTVIIVMIMQIKVGSSTLEHKIINLTHESKFAEVTQHVAQNAATFLGNQYTNLTGLISGKFPKFQQTRTQSKDRLKTKLQEIKDSINSEWIEEEKTNHGQLHSE